MTSRDLARRAWWRTRPAGSAGSPARCVAAIVATVVVVTGWSASHAVPAAPVRSARAPVTPPNDPLFRAQWGLRAIGAPEAWGVSTGVGAVVAVIDTGVAYEDFGEYRRAADLAGTRFVPGWDFVDDDAHPNDEPVAGRGSHGTHVAGVIAQTTNNGIGSAGVAPGAAIMPVRVLGPDLEGTSETIASGLRFAVDHGANVANLSLGGAASGPELADAVADAVKRGVTVVASAGEDGSGTVTFPAAFPDVIAVGAVRLDNTRAHYSNHGEALDLVAPGGDLSVDQDGDDLDDGIVQQALYEQRNSFCFCFVEGTSAAAAHVSGAAALLVASGRATTPAQVRETLMSTAKDLGPPGRDDEFGAGLVQASLALAVGPPGNPPVPRKSPAAGGDGHEHGVDDDHGDDRLVPAPASGGQRQASDRSRRVPAVPALFGVVALGIGLIAALDRRGRRTGRHAPAGGPPPEPPMGE